MSFSAASDLGLHCLTRHNCPKTQDKYNQSTNQPVKVYSLKGSIFLKNRHFFLSKKGSINLIYGINMIIKCGIWQPVKFQLVSHFLTGSKMKWLFYIISELMSATLILRYDKQSFHFWSSSRTRDKLKFYSATFYDCINTIYQFTKPFLDNKMSIFE